MRRIITVAVALALAALITACSDSDPEPSPTSAPAEDASADAAITIADFAFAGASSVAVGDTVTVTNNDTVGHTWTAQDGEFDSGTIAGGDSFEFTFETPGEFDYFCSIHPQMTGSIAVEG
jgi:plastocyanin